jgi:uroporphyrinogen decarboxylase
MPLSAALRESRFLKACRREPVDTTPVWIMRQAGRYLPEYMAVRRGVTFIELCKRPDLAAEVTLSAQRALGVDAAILFADLLPILEPMGIELEYAQGEGPVIHNPVRTGRDVDRVVEVPDMEALSFVFETVARVRRDLPANIPLIGFAGAPFTLASYVIEGGGSKNYLATKRLMYTDAGAWRTLMERLSASLVRYLRRQIEEGCQAVQLFDSWAGCLSPADYRNYVFPWTKAVIDGLPDDVPVINFLTGNPTLLPMCRAAGGDVIGLDWRIGLREGWQMIGHDRGVQGNLDPAALLASPASLRSLAEKVLSSAEGRPGHIFNLGHGVMPEADPNQVKALVRMVHDYGVRPVSRSWSV